MTDTRDPLDPVDRLIGGYFLLTAATQLLPNRSAGWLLVVVLHLGIGAFLVSGAVGRARQDAARRARESAGRQAAATRALLDWYPLLLFPFLYWELPLLTATVWDGQFFDDRVLAWEDAFFGGQPSTTLARRFDSLLFSEVVHGAYLSYYFLIYALPFVLYLHRRRDAFGATLFALMLGFLGTYALFIAFPVQGPRYLFPAPAGGLEAGPLYRLTHQVLETGSSRGAAFPSSHAAIGAIQTINAFRYLPAATPIMAVLTAGLSVGAVYGGFHYGVDILAGLAVGVAIGVVAPRFHGRRS